MAGFSQCTNRACGVTSEGHHLRCPACGNRATSSRTIRIASGVLIACGLILVGMMGWLIGALGPGLAGTAATGDSTFTGTPEQGAMILRLFWVVLGFGVLALGIGIVQMKSGKRQRWLSMLMIPLVIALAVMIWQVVTALSP